METLIDISQKQLIEKCCKNDRKSQAALYKTHYQAMMKVCLRYSGNREDANEILNSGFLKVFTSISNYNFQGSFEGWMRKIMVNTALDKIKSEQIQKQNTLVVEDYSAYENEIMVENDAVKGISSEVVLGLVNQLPLMSRSVFNLYVFDGYSHREISQMLGIKEGTSHWHLMNARTLLKEKISHPQTQIFN